MAFKDWFKKSVPVIENKNGSKTSQKRFVGAPNMNYVATGLSAWNGQSADNAKRYSRKTLRMKARTAADLNEYVRNWLSNLSNMVIGPDGIKLDCDYKSARNKSNEILNSSVKNGWTNFCKYGQPTIDGRLSMLDLEKKIIRNLAVDGEVIIQKVYSESYKFGFKLKVIDIDRLVNTGNVVNSSTGNSIKDGIEVDSNGATVAYHISERSESEGMGRVFRVPANQIYYLFLNSDYRMEQTRGVTWLEPVLNTIEHIDQFTKSTMEAVDWGARKMLILSSQSKEADTLVAQQMERQRQLDPGMAIVKQGGSESSSASVSAVEKQSDQDVIEELGNSVIPIDLKDNRAITVDSDFKPEKLEWSHANVGFVEFTKLLLMRLAAGLRCQYNTMANDLSGINLSSIRHGALSERDVYKSLQQFMVESFLQRVFEDWIDSAAMNKSLNLPLIQGGRDYYYDIKWIPRGFPAVDIQKEGDANRKDIQAGLNSARRVLAEQGIDIEEIASEIAQDNELYSKFEIVRVFDSRPPVIDTEDEPQKPTSNQDTSNK